MIIRIRQKAIHNEESPYLMRLRVLDDTPAD